MEEFFYGGGGETLAHIARRGSGGPFPGNIPGQVEWGSEQPDRVEDVLLTAGGLG